MEKVLDMRVQNIREKIAADDIDTLMVSTQENRRYLSGFTGEDGQYDETAGVLFITADDLKLATDGRYTQQAGEEALGLAARDAVRDLKSQIHEGFRDRLRQLVGHTLSDNDYLRQIISQIAAQSTPNEEAGPIELVASISIVADDAVRQRIAAGQEDAVLDFVRGMIGDSIRDGFRLRTVDHDLLGIQIRVENDDVEIDLTESSIVDLLASHLLPRFRAIMESL